MTPKLNDLQLILLSAAAGRPDGSLLPPPDSIVTQAARIKKVIPPLLKRQLVEEIGVSEATRSWREEAEQRFGLIITDAGRCAVGAEIVADDRTSAPIQIDQEIVSAAETSLASGEAGNPSPSPKSGSKLAMVVALLRRNGGATLIELGDATGWLPHSTRAALTGLRKKGHAITRGTRGDATVYTLPT